MTKIKALKAKIYNKKESQQLVESCDLTTSSKPGQRCRSLVFKWQDALLFILYFYLAIKIEIQNANLGDQLVFRWPLAVFNLLILLMHGNKPLQYLSKKTKQSNAVHFICICSVFTICVNFSKHIVLTITYLKTVQFLPQCRHNKNQI